MNSEIREHIDELKILALAYPDEVKQGIKELKQSIWDGVER